MSTSNNFNGDNAVYKAIIKLEKGRWNEKIEEGIY